MKLLTSIVEAQELTASEELAIIKKMDTYALKLAKALLPHVDWPCIVLPGGPSWAKYDGSGKHSKPAVVVRGPVSGRVPVGGEGPTSIVFMAPSKESAPIGSVEEVAAKALSSAGHDVRKGGSGVLHGKKLDVEVQANKFTIVLSRNAWGL